MSTKVATKNTTAKKSVKTSLKVDEKLVDAKMMASAPAPVKETVVSAPEVEVVEAEATGVAESTDLNIKQRFDSLIKSRQDYINELKKEIAELKKLQKDCEVELKNASKKSKNKKKVNEDGSVRKPSGFASPVVVSDKLYDFLSQFGVQKNVPIARTDVTRHITNYISKNNLQNPEYRREIRPDAALKALFGEPFEHKVKNDKNSELVYTYLQLQKYLSPHFPKAGAKPTA